MHTIQTIGTRFLAVLLFLFPGAAFAYPDFIGYGYGSCLTCHTNGLGGGAINDYGRGLWASELASRSLYSKSKTLEDISNSSGFLGNSDLIPWWVRPHIKYRGLYNQRNPGGGGQVDKFYPMQLDIGTSITLDEDSRFVLYGNMGYVPNAATLESGSMDRIVPRDYFARIQVAEPFWLYLGKMEKVFGIRNIDHTSVNRKPLLLTQNSQSHGAIIHYVQENYEISGNVFNGDQASSDPKSEQKGFSMMSEYQFIPRSRGGFSLLNSANENKRSIQAAAVHWRQGLSQGSALMFEYGMLIDEDKGLGTKNNGSYTFVESMVLMRKGYNLLVNLERLNSSESANTPETWRLGIGLLAFPINRVEWRMNVINLREVSSEGAKPDTWTLQGQLHVAL